MPALTRHLMVFALFAVFTAQGIHLIRQTSPTTDEIPFHAVNGYVYLMTGDFRMNPSSPALVREWMALPWLALRPKLDLSGPEWRDADSQRFGIKFMHRDNPRSWELLLTASRFMILILGVFLAWIVYRFSANLYGEDGGVISLAFLTLCPAVLGHSAIATTDIGAACCSTLAAFMFWRYWQRPDFGKLLVFSAALGLAFAAKSSALLFGPLFWILIVARHGWKKALEAAIVMVPVTFLVVWGSYFFEFRPLLGEGVPRVDQKLGYISTISQFMFPHNDTMERFLKTAALHMPIPIPSYLLALGGIIRQHSTPFHHYFMGSWGTAHSWVFYPLLFLTKMTLPFLLVLAARVISSLNRAQLWTAPNAVVVLLPAAFMAALLFETGSNGIRYFFPAMPLLFVWIGGSAVWLKRRAGRVFLASMFAASIAVLVTSYPNRLSYFNVLIGGTEQAPKYFRDSDVDWGQGLRYLKRYMDDNGLEAIKLHYFGTTDPSILGIQTLPISDAEKIVPERDVYAVSANYLDDFDWWRDRRFQASFGGIYVYDFR